MRPASASSAPGRSRGRCWSGSPSGAPALAQALAVLGAHVPLGVAAAVAGLEPDAARTAADALVRASLLAPGADLSFAHPIVRAAVEADIAPHRRAALHAA